MVAEAVLDLLTKSSKLVIKTPQGVSTVWSHDGVEVAKGVQGPLTSQVEVFGKGKYYGKDALDLINNVSVCELEVERNSKKETVRAGVKRYAVACA